MLKRSIKLEQLKRAQAMRAGDVVEMVRCAQRIERMQNTARALRAARRELAPLMVGAW